jgi:hypothetical protein
MRIFTSRHFLVKKTTKKLLCPMNMRFSRRFLLDRLIDKRLNIVVRLFQVKGRKLLFAVDSTRRDWFLNSY